MSNPQAPVCHVSKDEPVVPHTPVLVASIPAATDLASALAAIRALTQNMNAITGRIGSNGASGGRGPAGAAGAPGKAAPHNTRWAEAKRTVTEKTITDSTGQFSVTVQQITGLTMIDAVTGEQWTWKQ